MRILAIAVLAVTFFWQAACTPVTPAPQPPSQLQVLYVDYGSPAKLQPAQQQEILALLERDDLRRKTIWFIRVLRNDNRAARENDCRVQIFFTPESQTASVRKGDYLDLDMYKIRWIKKLVAETAEAAKRFEGTPHLFKYAQVADVASPFVEKLELPTPESVPFESPDGISDEDIVQIVAAVRAANSRDVERKSPILSIDRHENIRDAFVVYVGHVVGGLSGGGRIYLIHRTPNGFVADRDSAIWMN